MLCKLVHSVLIFTLTYGLDFEPKPSDSRSTLIFYRSGNELTSLHFRNKLDDLLAPYTKPSNYESLIKCDMGSPPEKGSSQVCLVEPIFWGGCVSSNGYNYNSYEGGPCVFLTLRKNRDWIPEYYNSLTAPKNMPQILKQHIKSIERDYGNDSNRLKVVWVTCKGESAFDREQIGNIIYYPTFGFPGQYFPIRNENLYMAPLIAVHFKNPERGALIMVRCKAWARNLEDETVHFELLVDY